MTLFASSNVYAPGEPRGWVGSSDGQRVSILGKYHLDQLVKPNLVIGALGLMAIAWLVHQHGGRHR